MIRNFEQREELNYNKIFASIIKSMLYKTIFTLIVVEDWDLKQMNVKIVFLYDQVEKEIYVKQSHDFVFEQYPFKVYKLNKTFYDLKQSFRVWYNIFVNYMKNIDLVFINVDFNVFIDLIIDIIVAFYVNNVFIIDSFKADI